MNIKNIVYLILLSMSVTAHAAPSAQPKKADADKWLTDFRAARNKTGDALFLNDPVKRAAHTQVIMELRDRAENLFSDTDGKYADCTKAAESVNSYWMNEVSLISNPTNNPHIKIGGAVTLAWDGGQSYASCRDLIDAIQ